MPRITESELRAVIDTAITDLTPFIAAASLWVDDIASAPCMTDDRAKQVELWLAAHITAVADATGGVQSIKAENLSKTFATSGTDVQSTRYGQTAILFDCTGTLANVGKVQPSIEVIGSL